MTKDQVVACIKRMEKALASVEKELVTLREEEDETLMFTPPYDDNFREMDVFYVHLGISLGMFKDSVTKYWDNPGHAMPDEDEDNKEARPNKISKEM